MDRNIAKWQYNQKLGLAMLQTLYSLEDHKAYASQVGLILGVHHGALNFEVGRYAKRIAENYDINFTARSQKKYKFWDLFFNGWEEGSKFVWQLRPELIEALERSGLSGDEHLPNELPNDISGSLFEGVKRSVTVNAYERNPRARALCVSHWQAICSVCGFNFANTYGKLGNDFIHVHHLIPVSLIGKSYQVDPINDLRPVCPNCHAMLHRKEPPLEIEELKNIIQEQASSV